MLQEDLRTLINLIDSLGYQMSSFIIKERGERDVKNNYYIVMIINKQEKRSRKTIEKMRWR